MNKFRIIFDGREIGSIGVFSEFSVEVVAMNFEEARKKLYDKFEHIKIKVVNRKKAL